MQSIISQLDDQTVWEEFLAHRLMKGRFTWPMFSDADECVENESYLPVARAFIDGTGPGIPEVKRINKMGTGKKRTVYCFSSEETRVLKLMAFPKLLFIPPWDQGERRHIQAEEGTQGPEHVGIQTGYPRLFQFHFHSDPPAHTQGSPE